MIWLILAALGVGLYGLTRPTSAAPGEASGAFVPSASDIGGAESLPELDAYMNLIGELYITYQISLAEYDILYAAYVARFEELIGA